MHVCNTFVALSWVSVCTRPCSPFIKPSWFLNWSFSKTAYGYVIAYSTLYFKIEVRNFVVAINGSFQNIPEWHNLMENWRSYEQNTFSEPSLFRKISAQMREKAARHLMALRVEPQCPPLPNWEGDWWAINCAFGLHLGLFPSFPFASGAFCIIALVPVYM